MKSLYIALTAAVGLTFAACEPATYEYHSTYFLPQSGTSMETYADQEQDSVRVVSYDSWSLSNDCNWMDIYKGVQKAPFSVSIAPGYWENTKLDLFFRPNTTGEIRGTYILVTSTYGEIGTVQKNLIQLPFHHITWPGVRTTVTAGRTVYTFSLDLTADGLAEGGKQAFVQFTPYAADARLVSDSEWLRPQTERGFEPSESVKVTLDCDANTTASPRTAVLSLVTGEGDTRVATQITVTQR